MGTISKEQYLEALEIVEEYHKQLNKEIEKRKLSIKNQSIEKGAMIEYIGGSNSKNLIKGESYEFRKFKDKYSIWVVNSRGKWGCYDCSYFVLPK